MIGYDTVGTDDVPRTAKFYDELLAVIGASRMMEDDNFVAWPIELGGANEGDPGPRMGPFYAGYFRDLDGNQLNAFCMVEGQE